MKRKILAFAVVPMLLLTGVGCSSKDKPVDSKTSIEQNKKEDYRTNLAYLMKDISEQSQVISNVLTSQKSVEEKQKEYEKVSKDLLKTSDKVKKLKYEEKYKDAQFTVETAMGLLDMSIKLVGDGLEMKDQKMMELGNDAVTKASKKLNEANKMMEEIK
ncbi:tungsten formylmethanofuran dehydrogenase [Bacillus toyonensis]|uniref:tungsten formylmethanofuran dehydrogenase n=1 Tax=Bacillus toyonensis TaxID=155322 RepID=UPI000BFDD4A2|nr:tungsten formylmethanofuran dehydrogenase [Bacillus toyonensis]PHE64178.1 tungsten formylmethanofuran dehydrogenase [Bacillus toyonensis]